MQASESLQVLLIEGKRKMAVCFAADLERKGYQVTVADSGNKGLEVCAKFSPSVVVINAASLRTNGLRLVSWFHNSLPGTPIFLIVGEETPAIESDGVTRLLRMPFTVQKLVNRLKPFARKSHKSVIVRGDLLLNQESKTAVYKNKEIHLTPRMAVLLGKMMEHSGEVLTREALFKAVWDTDYVEDTRTLDVHVSWLRQALEDDPRQPVLIRTVRGKGYQLIV